MGLEIVSGDDVSHRAKRRSLHRGRRIEKQFHETTAHSRLDDGLDLLVGPVREVAERPTRVGEDFLVGAEDELGQGGQTGLDHVEIRLGLPAAEVAEGPSGIPQHGQFAPLVKLLEERLHRPGLQDQVATGGGISRDVPEGPDGLLADVVVGREEEANEDGDGSHFHDHLGVLAGAGGDVGERPGRFELQGGVVVALEEFDEAGDDAALDDLLDGRVFLDGQEAAELGGAVGLNGGVVAHDALDHLGEVFQFVGGGSGRSGCGVDGHARAVAAGSGASGGEHGGGGEAGGGVARGGEGGHLTAFGEADIFFGFADLEGGFLAAAAAFVDVDCFFEAFFALLTDMRK